MPTWISAALEQYFHRHPADEFPELVVTGGASWGLLWAATWPLVQLKVFSWGIRIGPRFRLLRALVPCSDLQWSDIRSVQLKGVMGNVLRFDRDASYISFGKFSGVDEAVYALQEHGITVT
jgi:hypothetical protein